MDRPASPRARAAAVLLPLLGLFLLMPPFIRLFSIEYRPAGVPLVVAYLFGVWLALVACAAWLARRLDVRRDPDVETPHMPAPDNDGSSADEH